MKINKTLAGVLTATVMMASLSLVSSADPVSTSYNEVLGTAVFAADEDGNVDGSIYVFDADEYELDQNTVVTASVNAADGTDTSEWQLALLGYTKTFGGWAGLSGDNNVLTFTATVGDIMKANDIDSTDSLGGILFQVWNVTDGDELEYTVTISYDTAQIGDTEEPDDPYATEDEPEDMPESSAIAVTGTGTTKIDPDGFVRTTIVNTFDSNPVDTIADGSHFKGAEVISVQFTVTEFTEPFKAWLMLADKTSGIYFSYLDDSGNANAESVPAEVTGNGTYVVYITLDKPVKELNYLAVSTDIKPAEGDDFPAIAVDSIVINDIIGAEPGISEYPKDIILDEPPVRPEDKNPGDESGNLPTGGMLTVFPAVLAAGALISAGVALRKRSK